MPNRKTTVHHEAPPIRGYAWHVYADLATPGVMVGDDPFSSGDAPGPTQSLVCLPVGVVQHWKLYEGVPGIENRILENSFLVLTEDHEPPPVSEGWFAEAARLDNHFLLDQGGDRWVRVLRILDTAQSEVGTVESIEFEVDHTR